MIFFDFVFANIAGGSVSIKIKDTEKPGWEKTIFLSPKDVDMYDPDKMKKEKKK